MQRTPVHGKCDLALASLWLWGINIDHTKLGFFFQKVTREKDFISFLILEELEMTKMTKFGFSRSFSFQKLTSS